MTSSGPDRRRTAGLVLLLWLLAAAAGAHEIRPAYLQFSEQTPGEFEEIWKQPVSGPTRLPLQPRLPEGCARIGTVSSEHTGLALIERSRVRCDLRSGLLHIDGLAGTLTDVMVRVDYLDGESMQQLLRPESPSLDLADPAPPAWDYLRLGVDHLIFGIDHILFVVGLVLLIRSPWMLLKTITAFTLAHSLTLAGSVLGLVHLSQGPVEAIIALSILFLARELLVPAERQSRLTRARPWVIALAFGLLHGFGFAGALAEVGLPREQLALSLLLFNVGIEVGQLLLVGAMLTLGWLGHRLLELGPSLPARTVPAQSTFAATFSWPHAWTLPCALAMGVVAGYWSIDRVTSVLL